MTYLSPLCRFSHRAVNKVLIEDSSGEGPTPKLSHVASGMVLFLRSY